MRARRPRREFTSGVADESKAESVLSILSIFLVGYRFSFSLSFARARASDVYNFCADFPLYSFLNKRIQFSAMVKAP